MIINGKRLFALAPIIGMLDHKVRLHGVSHGLAEAGYDIRLNQDITFYGDGTGSVWEYPYEDERYEKTDFTSKFVIASAIEEFDMPTSLVGVVHDKSTWARKGLSVFNTVIEPGWKGFLTLELVYHGNELLQLKRGTGIAQVLFSSLVQENAYDGKYQNQENKPVPSIFEE